MKGSAIHYSDAELFWIHDNHRRPRREAHEEFQAVWDRPDVSLTNFNSLCKRKGWMTGRSGQFRSGQEPHNKGKPMPSHPNSRRTQFKAGAKPHTYRGPGHERIDSKEGYVILIVDEPNPWTGASTRPVHKHRWLWEKKNGPVPDGCVLKCLDGDKTNTDPGNWKAVPRSVLPRLAGRWNIPYDSAPDELKPALLAIAEIEHAIRERRQDRKRTA
ncbi:HNH endonuclease signature motif containing protein [Ponticoccus sp. (in: a-proteobacteria)]|uniref:HNH endonuclease signature motif containing protein n=1 Tax=Ponticoccus sp. (in: a-proteobacteria) TaxID=1925025 RepID=UPI003AB7041B